METKIKKELMRIAKKDKKNRTKKETEFIKNQLKKIPLINEKEFLEKIRTEINQQIESMEMLNKLSREIL